MTENKNVRLDPVGAQNLCTTILEAGGVSGEGAKLIAENLILADLRGIGSHGISRMAVYCDRLDNGHMDPYATPEILSQSDSTALFDAHNAPGAVAGVAAMDLCIKKAAESGIASCAVKHSNHYGIAAFYAKRALSKNMIGISFSNAPATMAPWGSITPMMGTNPFCYAIPANRRKPIILDCATSLVARGKINLAEIEGKEIPLGWAVDSSGRPTTNATEALLGSVLPLGGYKGSGLSIVIDVLCGVLSGASFGKHIGPLYANADTDQNLGHFFIAIDISRFSNPDDFKKRIDSMIDEIKNAEKADGTGEIYLPGEIEFMNEEENLIRGIEVGPGVMRELRDLCDRYTLKSNPEDLILKEEVK